MSIDWTHFTPWASLAGGALIGVAASMLVLLSGRIAGISGILGGLIALRRRREPVAVTAAPTPRVPEDAAATAEERRS